MFSQPYQPHTRRAPLATIGLAAVLLIGGAFTTPAVFADDEHGTQEHKGADMLTITGVGSNIARCGVFPQHVELHFAGQGADNLGGPFSAVSSACQNTVTNQVFDLNATDTYEVSGDTISIHSESFVLAPNPATCVATNDKLVKYTVTGGTGAFANATGKPDHNLPDALGRSQPRAPRAPADRFQHDGRHCPAAGGRTAWRSGQWPAFRG